MKKSLFLFLMPTSTIPLIASISCQATIDKRIMNWSIDKEKVNNFRSNQTLIDDFNKNTIPTLDKLKKIIKFDNSNNSNGDNFIERYTIEAFDKGWFDTISFQNDQNKTLIIRLHKSKEINGKTVYCPYVLPNGSLDMFYY